MDYLIFSDDKLNLEFLKLHFQISQTSTFTIFKLINFNQILLNSVNKQLIQWYPGHIAKAEKQLKEHLNKVDLVFEVRDARIPLATSHPYLQKWLRGKKQILVINRKDMINVDAYQAWDKKLRSEGKIPWWCDAKAGTGVLQIKQAAIRAGQ